MDHRRIHGYFDRCKSALSVVILLWYLGSLGTIAVPGATPKPHDYDLDQIVGGNAAPIVLVGNRIKPANETLSFDQGVRAEAVEGNSKAQLQSYDSHSATRTPTLVSFLVYTQTTSSRF